jgi:hypothetical protein
MSPSTALVQKIKTMHVGFFHRHIGSNGKKTGKKLNGSNQELVKSFIAHELWNNMYP